MRMGEVRFPHPKSSPAFAGEGGPCAAWWRGGATAPYRSSAGTFASLPPLHHPSGGPPPLESEGRILKTRSSSVRRNRDEIDGEEQGGAARDRAAAIIAVGEIV